MKPQTKPRVPSGITVIIRRLRKTVVPPRIQLTSEVKPQSEHRQRYRRKYMRAYMKAKRDAARAGRPVKTVKTPKAKLRYMREYMRRRRQNESIS